MSQDFLTDVIRMAYRTRTARRFYEFNYENI